MKNIFKYINFLLFIFLNNLSIANEIYSCIINENIVYTDKYKSSCSKKVILPNLIIENNLYDNNHIKQNITLKNNLNKLSKSNSKNKYTILINELNNETAALNKARKILLINDISTQYKQEILNEINDRKHNIYLLKKEISKIKE